jgi:Rps23 Pro-64 3,4-dihydroxylase Tpa1-like proline 4-hydroxylase
LRARTIFPKPNRIAFLSPRAMHLLTRIDTNAGQQARISVAGFFHRNVPPPGTGAPQDH